MPADSGNLLARKISQTSKPSAPKGKPVLNKYGINICCYLYPSPTGYPGGSTCWIQVPRYCRIHCLYSISHETITRATCNAFAPSRTWLSLARDHTTIDSTNTMISIIRKSECPARPLPLGNGLGDIRGRYIQAL